MGSSIGLFVDKADLTSLRRAPGLDPTGDEPAAGEVLLEVASFGLTTNNISYAAVGDTLGYWAYFPAPTGEGRLPVWGFADVVRSEHPDVVVGERVFGFLPLAPHLLIAPSEVSDLALSDGSSPRNALHPWYNRYYRCAADPVFEPEYESLQPVMWALFMTGWKLAQELAGLVDEVIVSSASSKTAVSFAWSMRNIGGPTSVVGVTSAAHAGFVDGLGVYDRVATYDDLGLDRVGNRAGYVDMAGNGAVSSAIHDGLGDRLVDSVLVGGTHRARGESELSGPEPRFFFIPAVAEAQAATVGLDEYHGAFAAAWRAFVVWAAGWMEVEHGVGIDAIEAAYHHVFEGVADPAAAAVLRWED